jgi:hypothetical protein
MVRPAGRMDVRKRRIKISHLQLHLLTLSITTVGLVSANLSCGSSVVGLGIREIWVTRIVGMVFTVGGVLLPLIVQAEGVEKDEFRFLGYFVRLYPIIAVVFNFVALSYEIAKGLK